MDIEATVGEIAARYVRFFLSECSAVLPVVAALLAASPRVAQAQASEGSVARIHLETASDAVTLNQRDALGHPDRPICRAPCDRTLETSSGRTFFFAGEGLPSSREFELSDRFGDVTIRVKPPEPARRSEGALLLGLGSVALGSGLVLFPLLAWWTKPGPGEPGGSGSQFGAAGHVQQSAPSPCGWAIGGAVASSLGLAAVVAGVVLLTTSRTRYSVVIASPMRGGLGLAF